MFSSPFPIIVIVCSVHLFQTWLAFFVCVRQDRVMRSGFSHFGQSYICCIEGRWQQQFPFFYPPTPFLEFLSISVMRLQLVRTSLPHFSPLPLTIRPRRSPNPDRLVAFYFQAFSRANILCVLSCNPFQFISLGLVCCNYFFPPASWPRSSFLQQWSTFPFYPT